MTFNVELSKEVAATLITWNNYLFASMIDLDIINNDTTLSEEDKKSAIDKARLQLYDAIEMMKHVSQEDSQATIDWLVSIEGPMNEEYSASKVEESTA